jgi:hypothetical protein
MSTATFASVRRARLYSAAAVLGVVLAVGWFIAVRSVSNAAATTERAAKVEKGAKLVALLRHTAQDRVKTGAQVLAQDTRMQAAVGQAEMDRLTINDLLQDLQKLDPQEVFALLTPNGKVIAALGAKQMEGLDLSSSNLVKTRVGGRVAG